MNRNGRSVEGHGAKSDGGGSQQPSSLWFVLLRGSVPVMLSAVRALNAKGCTMVIMFWPRLSTFSLVMLSKSPSRIAVIRLLSAITRKSPVAPRSWVGHAVNLLFWMCSV